MNGLDGKFVSKEKGAIEADSHLVSINSKYGIEDIDIANILLIPGSSVAFVREMKDEEVLTWMERDAKGSLLCGS